MHIINIIMMGDIYYEVHKLLSIDLPLVHTTIVYTHSVFFPLFAPALQRAFNSLKSTPSIATRFVKQADVDTPITP